jgi:DNA-directed RNA polymerase specialized sigma24 family protein
MSYSEKRRSVNRLAGQLFAEKRTHLLGIARRNSAREADAEDALQEAFAAFIASFDPDCGAPPLAWLTLVLKRACWRARERRAIDVEPLALAEVMTAERLDPAVPVGEYDEARRRLGALKADERKAIVLHGAGFAYGEIGTWCGWSATKVNRCLYEGRRALKGSR